MTIEDFKDYTFILIKHKSSGSCLLLKVIQFFGCTISIENMWTDGVVMNPTRTRNYSMKSFEDWTFLKGYHEIPNEFLV